MTALSAWMLGGFLSFLPEGARAALLVAGALTIWVCQRGLLPWKLPQTERQIPSEVFGGGLVKGALRFGLELGTGVRTYVPSPAPYILLLVILAGNLTFGWALAIAAGFGTGRAVPLLLQLGHADRERVTQLFLRGPIEVAPGAASCIVLLGGLILG